jgi:hypothetical protein
MTNFLALIGAVGFTPSGAHTENASLSSAVTLTKPEGAHAIIMQCFDQNVRYRLDGTNPDADTGFRLTAGNDPVVIPVPGDDVRVIEETATATLQYQWLS